jgi:EAL and modified HD-GYP domain-containing signal transduction protein
VDLATGQVWMGRQGIYDRSGSLVAHELMFRGLSAFSSGPMAAPRVPATEHDGDTTAEDRGTSELIATTFGDFGLWRLSGGLPLYLNLTRAFLVAELPLPFDPDGIVLELLEEVAGDDDEVLAGMRRLRSRGFQLALGDFVGERSRLGLLEHVDVVKVDLLGLSGPLDDVLELCRRHAPQARLLAENVEDEAMLGICRDSGFALFQGPQLHRPVLLETARMSPTRVMCLRLLRTLGNPSATTSDIEDIVAGDPGLSLRILRSANSAAAAPQHTITSLRQAIVLLGPRILSGWVTLTLLGGLTPASRVNLVTVLTRAGCCESIARLVGRDTVPVATAYLAGMLSGVAQVTRTDVGQLVAGAGIDDELISALTLGSGALGEIVDAVLSHEAGVPSRAAHLDITDVDLARTYLGSWKLAVAHVSRILDG